MLTISNLLLYIKKKSTVPCVIDNSFFFSTINTFCCESEEIHATSPFSAHPPALSNFDSHTSFCRLCISRWIAEYFDRYHCPPVVSSRVTIVVIEKSMNRWSDGLGTHEYDWIRKKVLEEYAMKMLHWKYTWQSWLTGFTRQPLSLILKSPSRLGL